jgi:hypothetical protein
MDLVRLTSFLEKVASSLMSVIRVLVLSRPTGRFTADHASCVVLGNGPSLTTTISKHRHWLETQPAVAVNLFCVSDEFERLKPAYYVLQAPEFHMYRPPSKDHEDSRNRLWSELILKTTWPLTLFLPVQARKSTYLAGMTDLNNHPWIRIQYYNPTPVEGFDGLSHWLFSIGAGMPRPHNVLLPSVLLMISAGIKTIFIVGADHSWHETVQVGATGPSVDHVHFYDRKEERMHMLKLDGKPYFIHDMFRKWYLAFKGYHELQAYANHTGTTILNASERSYIDAFPRVSITDTNAQS